MAKKVRLGAAHIDERGKATGGAAGDQTGKEVCIRDYYVHSKGWRVLRPVSGGDQIALCMEAACANNNIGYDQNQRNTLYNAVKSMAFDVRKLTTKVETDCSALVRVCCAFAGILLGDFNTGNEASVLLNSGKFMELTGDKYTKQDAYLKKGDILVTKTKGHTEVVLDNGSKVGNDAPAASSPSGSTSGTTSGTTAGTLGSRILKKGMTGKDVNELQSKLMQLGYAMPKYGADGDYGSETVAAVKKFQKDHGCGVDGEVGKETLAALTKALGAASDSTARHVQIVGGQCWVRTAPNTKADQLGIAKEGELLPYGGQQSADGWYLVAYKNRNGWISGKYGKLVN